MPSSTPRSPSCAGPGRVLPRPVPPKLVSARPAPYPDPMEASLATPLVDSGAVLARLRAARWALGRSVLLMRAGVAVAMVVVAARPSGGTRESGWDVAIFVAYLAWAVATGALGRRLFTAVERRPGWLWAEQALCVCLVVVGGGARVIALYACALPIIIATVF